VYNPAMFRFVLLACFIVVAAGQGTADACTYYASPVGTGNGTSTAQPFRIASFWPLAKPGHTLCLLDGQYTGVTSMINPPQTLSGTASARITVRALNDGKVRIDGQAIHVPVRLYYNDYFIIEGINASNSIASVVALSNSNNNIVRRVTAWDAADGNHSIFGIHNGSYNLLEDVAGWGIARKIYESSQGGNYTTIRRAWGRWEGSHVVGPKMTYTLAYNNHNMLVENAIGTWSGERMKESYVLLDYYGKPWTGNGAGTYTNYGVNQAYGIFGNDGFTGTDKNARTRLLGSLAYIRGSDRYPASQAVFITKIDSMEIAQTVAYIQPGAHTSKKPFALYNLQTSAGTNLVARNNTAVGGAISYFGTEWKKSALSEASSLSAIANPFAAASSGANLCFRYQDGVLTTRALWPWAMNQRIIDATIQSGRAAVNITATVESMLGPIPSGCKATTETVGSGPTAPSAPASLKVTP
jgi:hypothetical protein